MSKVLAAIARKTLGLALIFNSIVVLICVGNILATYYASAATWKPYAPFLFEGSLFWFALLTAFLNIAPSKLVGKASIRRLFFHHYVYGFMSIFTTLLLVLFLAPAYIFVMLAPSQGFHTGLQTVPIYACMVLICGGLTLVVDDIYDVSLRLAKIFDKIRMKMSDLSRALQTVHLCSSLMSLCITACAAVWYDRNSYWLRNWPLENLAHILFISNMFLASIWGLKIVKGKLWLRTLKKPNIFLWLGERMKA